MENADFKVRSFSSGPSQRMTGKPNLNVIFHVPKNRSSSLFFHVRKKESRGKDGEYLSWVLNTAVKRRKIGNSTENALKMVTSL